MSSQPQPTAPSVQPNGGAALAERVLTAPERGAGYFFPATAGGFALTLATFAFTLGLLSIANAEWINLSALGIIVPVAFGYGALGLVIGGLWDFRANNLVGGVAGVSYASFWLSLALLLQFFGTGIVEATGPQGFFDAFGAYLVMWGIFSAYIAVALWFQAKMAFLGFLLLAVVFFILGIANMFAPGAASDDIRRAGGYVGIVDAAGAWYLSAALVINATAGRQLLPIR